MLTPWELLVMTLMHTVSTKTPFSDSAEQVVFSKAIDPTNFVDQRLDKHRLLTVAITKLFKQLQDVTAGAETNEQMLFFVFAIQEYLISQIKRDFSPITETLMSLVMLMQEPDHLYFKHSSQWNSKNHLSLIKDSLESALLNQPNPHLLWVLLNPTQT